MIKPRRKLKQRMGQQELQVTAKGEPGSDGFQPSTSRVCDAQGEGWQAAATRTDTAHPRFR